MKKILTIAFMLVLISAFAGCGAQADDPTQPSVSTEPESYSAVDPLQTEPESSITDPTSQPAQSTEAKSAASSVTTVETTTVPEKVDALQLFNEATRKAVQQKAAYKKTRYTKITSLDFGALGRFQIVKDAVYGFFDVPSSGEGTLITNVKKGQASDQLRASSLRPSDIKSATAEPDGQGGYIVTILIKDGTTRWSGEGGTDPGHGTLNSPIDRGPLCYGEDSDSKYDHKTAKNIYLSINGADEANTKDIGEKSYNIKATAKIDSQGRLQKLEGYLEMTVDVYHVKYLVVTLNNKSGKGFGRVTYENFVY